MTRHSGDIPSDNDDPRKWQEQHILKPENLHIDSIVSRPTSCAPSALAYHITASEPVPYRPSISSFRDLELPPPSINELFHIAYAEDHFATTIINDL
jgi:hypothetical protein